MPYSTIVYNLLLVDDTPANLCFLGDALEREGYLIRVAPSGDMAIRMAQEEAPDLVLLDIDMPGINGYQVCDSFKKDLKLKSIPIIFLSALQDTQAKVLAFKHGGVDYATKPFRLEELLSRVSTHLELQTLRRELEAHNASLSKMVSDQFQEIYAAQLSTIVALTKLSETRDDDTGMHIDRVGAYSRRLAQEARQSTDFNCEITDEFEDILFHAAAMHDIGKVGISDSILLKPGKLTPEEFHIMKMHPELGYRTLNQIQSNYPGNRMVAMGAEIAYCHHEKWDGSGYPRGLKQDAIPLSARFVAIADVYDALRAVRPYKKSFTHKEALDIMKQGAGLHFDPRLLAIFDSINTEFNDIWLSHQDNQKIISN